MFDKLAKHHLGFIIPCEHRGSIEQKTGKKFVYDQIQQTHVLFEYSEYLNIYIEYICREGRVAKQKPGFAHICYSVKTRDDLRDAEKFIQESKLGYPLTDLEKSGSEECGWIKFYFIKNHGVIELNLCDDD